MIRPRRHSRRKLAIAVAVLAVVAAAVALVGPVVAGRTTAPQQTLTVAERALARAREDRAGAWAPELLSAAQTVLDEARVEYRRQELRFLSLRDFDTARERLLRARELAEQARRTALDRESGARDAAESAIAQTTRVLADAERLADVVPLERSQRRRLVQARIGAGEADDYFLQGDYLRARDRAEAVRVDAVDVIERGAARAGRYVDRALLARWRDWIDDTVAWSRGTGRAAIVVYKERNLLSLYVKGRLRRTYRADLSRNPLDPKLRRGDEAVPEGRYRIVAKKGRGETVYHKALLLDYPNDDDLRRFEQARRSGSLPRGARPGGSIEIHGEGGRGVDWTRGCVALANGEMDDLYSRVETGTPVTIVGGVGSDGRYSRLLESLSAYVDGAR
jgi:hypothetical protein